MTTDKKIRVAVALLGVLGALARVRSEYFARQEFLDLEQALARTVEHVDYLSEIIAAQDKQIDQLDQNAHAVVDVVENLYAKVDRIMKANKTNMQAWVVSMEQKVGSLADEVRVIGERSVGPKK